MDSVAGSIILSRVLELEALQVEGENPSIRRVFYPMVVIPKEQFKIRKDQVSLFNGLGMEESDLFFLDHLLLLRQADDEDRVSIHLFDGNTVPDYLSMFKYSVESIVDHHKDENHYNGLNVRKQITDVGSCTSLLVQRFLESGELHMSWAKLALAPIALDTSFFAKKMTLMDEQARSGLFRSLEKSTRGEFNDENALLFYEKLKEAREDIEGLTPSQLLQKDGKSWTIAGLELAVATIPGGYRVDWHTDPVHRQALQDQPKFGSHPMGLSKSPFFMTAALGGQMIHGKFVRFFQVNFASDEHRDAFYEVMSKDPDVDSSMKSEEYPTACFTLPAGCSRKELLKKLYDVMPQVVSKLSGGGGAAAS